MPRSSCDQPASQPASQSGCQLRTARAQPSRLKFGRSCSAWSRSVESSGLRHRSVHPRHGGINPIRRTGNPGLSIAQPHRHTSRLREVLLCLQQMRGVLLYHCTPPSTRSAGGDHETLQNALVAYWLPPWISSCDECPLRSCYVPVLCVDTCLLYTSDAADEEDSVDLGGRRIIKKKK
eukprot:TRINITY_DN57223_c0_g1_i1.p1 TRINITY_DN57223_c0_g1~~TRINITY_DN57223_c0_g1_i1.p1  ORF type:complete len:178 (-),score=12.13 TRINITY_DN57223_c0_g1_i1:109-642(-)